jgi:hypothetical protein
MERSLLFSLEEALRQRVFPDLKPANPPGSANPKA